MRIVFFPQSCPPHHGKSLFERPLGGIETAIIRLAEALHKRDHEVIVCSSHPQIPHSLPPYVPLSSIDRIPPHDVFLCIREWIPLVRNIPCRIKLFWTGDSFDQVHNFGLGDRRVAHIMDAFCPVSDWHGESMANASGFPKEKIEKLPYGIHKEYFQKKIPRHPRRLIYTSTPFRGLQYLPDIFVTLKKEFPDLELIVCSGFEVYQRDDKDQETQAFTLPFVPLFEKLRALPGVQVLGNITQDKLAEQLLGASILAYPNTFAETFCIAALEAQAAGCVPVSSALGALPETIGDAGILIKEKPGTDAYLLAFLNALRDLLSHPEKLHTLSHQAQEKAFKQTWDDVAVHFEKMINRIAEKKGISVS